MGKRILIVDDDKDMLTMLQLTLKNMAPTYDVITAQGSIEAMEQIGVQSFDLVVTDYMMKDITGVDLARAVRAISPLTPIVLMSAYGTKRLRDTTEFLGLASFVDKPFSPQKITSVIKTILGDISEKIESPNRQFAIGQSVREHIKDLQIHSHARCSLLIRSDGHPVYIAGQLGDLRIFNISALIAANFMGASELASLLGNRAEFKSTFHQGDDYNIYIYAIDSEFLLAVLFEAARKPGVVWVYTKQAAQQLKPLLKELSKLMPSTIQALPEKH